MQVEFDQQVINLIQSSAPGTAGQETIPEPSQREEPQRRRASPER